MTRRTVRTCVVITLSAFALGSYAASADGQPHPKPAAAPPKPLAQALTGEAKADYDAAKTLASDGDFAGALIKFNSAYDQSKDPRLLWNVAFCEKNLRHYSKVITTLNRYLAEGSGYLTDRDRKDAQDLVQTLQPFTTNATFKVSEDGAQILVDDAPVGVSPLSAPVPLDIGERHLRILKEGFKPFEKTLPVGGSASVTIEAKLEKELHEGHLLVNAPPNAALELDEKPVGTGKFDGTIAAGGHQLRATAPGMRPFQTEVVIQDKETRQVDVALERLAEPERPKIRAAIGCDGPEPLGPDDGLVMYLDGPDVIQPANVKKRWDDSLGRNVVEYVEYPANPGTHSLRARIPECNSLETSIYVDQAKGADLKGALPTETPLLFRGPQGAPGHWRLGLDLWMFRPSYDKFQANDMPDAYQGGLGAATGTAIEGSFITRWFGVFVQTAFGKGQVQRATFDDTTHVLPSTANVTAFQSMLRASFRIPFNIVSWNIVGAEAGALEFDMRDAATGGDFITGKLHGIVGAWGGIDIQPLCDWGARVLYDAEFVPDWNGSNNNHGGNGPAAALQMGLFWEPNARCRRERSTDFGLRAERPPQ